MDCEVWTRDDRSPMCRIEYMTMKLAQKAGITVPPVRLERVLGQDIYLVERFDRVPNEDRLPARSVYLRTDDSRSTRE